MCKYLCQRFLLQQLKKKKLTGRLRRKNLSVMNWIVDTLRTYPELAIFLTMGIGFWIGNKKFGSFSLGAVTSVLLTGVLVGQLKIDISPNVKAVFFLLFL